CVRAMLPGAGLCRCLGGVESESKIAKAEECADDLAAAADGDEFDIAEEAGNAALTLGSPVDFRGAHAEGVAANHRAGGVTAGEGQGDVVNAVGAAHARHRIAYPARDLAGEAGGLLFGARRRPAAFGQADTITNQAFYFAAGGNAAKHTHHAVVVGW